jgi:hypothetical protein
LSLADLLIDKLPADKPPAPALSLFQIQRIQSAMASASEDFSSDNEPSVTGSRLDFLDAPPLIDADLPKKNVDVEEEERMIERAKMYTDRGNGCFTNKEILSICLLGIMHDIGAHLSAFENCSIQGCDYSTRSHYHHLPSPSHSHQPFIFTILHERAVPHCFDPAKSCKQSFLPSPSSQCSGHD